MITIEFYWPFLVMDSVFCFIGAWHFGMWFGAKLGGK